MSERAGGRKVLNLRPLPAPLSPGTAFERNAPPHTHTRERRPARLAVKRTDGRDCRELIVGGAPLVAVIQRVCARARWAQAPSLAAAFNGSLSRLAMASRRHRGRRGHRGHRGRLGRLGAGDESDREQGGCLLKLAPVTLVARVQASCSARPVPSRPVSSRLVKKCNYALA